MSKLSYNNTRKPQSFVDYQDPLNIDQYDPTEPPVPPINPRINMQTHSNNPSALDDLDMTTDPC